MSTRQETKVILMAEDDEDDLLLVKSALAASGLPVELRSVSDGEELMEYLFRRNSYEDSSRSPVPSLILLDLNMPKKDGIEILSEIKAHPLFKRIPVVILTTSRESEDVQQCYALGASCYVTKPNSFQALVEVLKTTEKYLLEPLDPLLYDPSIDRKCGTRE